MAAGRRTLRAAAPGWLCPIQCACGEEALCRTCRTHPRFWEEYGATRELTLALSCPGAARLLLSHTSPLHLTETELDAPVTPNDLDPALYLALRRVRTAMIRLAQTRSLALPDRLGLILRLASAYSPCWTPRTTAPSPRSAMNLKHFHRASWPSCGGGCAPGHRFSPAGWCCATWNI